jgi:hypothetical protein
MTRLPRITLVLFFLAFCAAGLLAQGDLQLTRVSVIKSNPTTFLNERVRIDGFVTQFVDAGSKSTSFFYLKDDWGAVIKVRTSKEAPSVGKRYSIEGPVGLDPRTKDLYVSEESRIELVKPVESVIHLNDAKVVSPPKTEASGDTSADVPLKATGTQTVTATQAAKLTTTTEPAKPVDNVTIYLLIGAAAVIVLIAAIFLMLRTRRDEMRTEEYGVLTATRAEAPLPPPEQVIEGRTIKLHAPPPGTVKLLPGWFDVVGGDEVVKQIRFYSLGGERGAETTFGRVAGRPYAHIQLKAPTVSSRQAKVAFDNGAAHLTNLASSDSNPTKLNGREMGVNESVALSESDRVEMGEVSLLFHAASTTLTKTAIV